MTLYLEALRSLLPQARISSKFLPNIHRLPRTASPVKIFCVSTKCPFLFQVGGGTLSSVLWITTLPSFLKMNLQHQGPQRGPKHT